MLYGIISINMKEMLMYECWDKNLVRECEEDVLSPFDEQDRRHIKEVLKNSEITNVEFEGYTIKLYIKVPKLTKKEIKILRGE